MKLFLTSAGLTCESIKQSLFDLTGTSEIRTAFIPTAANGEAGDKSWLIDDMFRFNEIGEIDIVNIELYSGEEITEKLSRANVIVFGGGNTQYLMHEIEEKGLRDSLFKLLESRVYVGISAGSIITSSDLSSSDAYIFDESFDGFIPKGLSLTNIRVLPHLNSLTFPNMREEKLQAILEKEKIGTCYALDDMSAVRIVDGSIEVISEGIYKVFG